MDKLDREPVFDFAITALLFIVLVIVAYPLWFIIIASFSDPAKVASGKVMFWPQGLTLDGYRQVFQTKDVVSGFANSILYTVLGTAINLAVTVPAAFSLSRPHLKGRNWIMLFFTITMFISGGLVPTFLVVRQLKLLNTIWAMVIPSALSVYNMIIARTFFQSNIDTSLVEAAKMDGCSNLRFFVSIALPISKAIIAILVLYYGVSHWNAYFSALIYLNDRAKFPLQLVLRTILIQNQQMSQAVQDVQELQRQQQLAEMMKYSLIIVASVPMLLLYPFIQKHFVKGVMIGSLKG